jgi:hypothetical protein
VKTFYTERDIEDMHSAGVREIEVDDDVVLTDLAREKVIALGLHMKRVEKRSGQPDGLPRMAVAPQMQLPPAVTGSSEKQAPSSPASALPQLASSAAVDSELVSQVKSAVIARLGTSEHNGLLDQIIPQVLARLTQSGGAVSGTGNTSSAKND